MSLRDWEYFSFGAIVGIAAGVVAGLLIAPQEGKEARKKIAGYANVVKDSVSDLIGQAKDSLDAAAVKAESMMGHEKERVAKKLEEIKTQLENLEAQGS